MVENDDDKNHLMFSTFFMHVPTIPTKRNEKNRGEERQREGERHFFSSAQLIEIADFHLSK